MDSTKLILTQPTLPCVPLARLGDLDSIPEQRRKQIARDFEAILVNKMLEVMENTIGKWGFEKDGASKQINGLFSLYLSDHIAKNGGMGLWPSIYESLFESD